MRKTLGRVLFKIVRFFSKKDETMVIYNKEEGCYGVPSPFIGGRILERVKFSPQTGECLRMFMVGESMIVYFNRQQLTGNHYQVDVTYHDGWHNARISGHLIGRVKLCHIGLSRFVNNPYKFTVWIPKRHLITPGWK